MAMTIKPSFKNFFFFFFNFIWKKVIWLGKEGIEKLHWNENHKIAKNIYCETRVQAA